ncbi:MAG: hypothetical protein FRX49_01045 [Trebouxia sp. A1-2]|nr:MAG: hypothetical protein FRX49_01045 [Trebouxia sp. A1-2]
MTGTEFHWPGLKRMWPDTEAPAHGCHGLAREESCAATVKGSATTPKTNGYVVLPTLGGDVKLYSLLRPYVVSPTL